mgnify:CR=1 FL=1
MLVRLLYVSRATESTTESLEAILQRARRHNAEHGITGILCYSNNIFMQLLEGSREEVNCLYSEIQRDSHHTNVQLFHYDEITEREYPGWTMGLVDIDQLNTSIILKYSEGPDFNPYANSGWMSLAMLEELAATAQVVGRG